MQTTTTLSLSPSFSSYSNSKIAEIAARTVDEFDSDDEFDFDERKSSPAQGDDGEDEEFAFAMTAKDSKLPSLTSADDIFQNGKILPVYSVFNRDSLLGRVKVHNEIEKENSVRDSVSPKIRLPLRKLFLEERETTITTSSSSSSEADELDGETAVTYCVWPAKAEAEEVSRCKKSSSVGCNSKRWKLKDFLHMSRSDGSENDFVVLKENEKKSAGTPADGEKMKAVAPCNLNGGEKQRSYLRYGHDLAGLFVFGDGSAFRKKLETF